MTVEDLKNLKESVTSINANPEEVLTKLFVRMYSKGTKPAESGLTEGEPKTQESSETGNQPLG